MNKSKICYREILSFALVGTVGYVIHNGLIWVVHVYGGYGIFVVVHFLCGGVTMIINFFFNNAFVFSQRTKGCRFRFLQRMVLFMGVCMVGICISTVVAWVSRELYFGEGDYVWLYSSTMGIGVGFIWNYFVSKKKIWECEEEVC